MQSVGGHRGEVHGKNRGGNRNEQTVEETLLNLELTVGQGFPVKHRVAAGHE